MLVEDDDNDILLIQRAFRKARVSTQLALARDGEEAITHLTGCRDEGCELPLAILLDLKLPRASGLEVLEWLRREPGLKRLPVIVLTSSREQGDLRRAYDLGANSYLIKPVNFDVLADMMQVVNHYWVTLNEQPATEH